MDIVAFAERHGQGAARILHRSCRGREGLCLVQVAESGIGDAVAHHLGRHTVLSAYDEAFAMLHSLCNFCPRGVEMCRSDERESAKIAVGDGAAQVFEDVAQSFGHSHACGIVAGAQEGHGQAHQFGLFVVATAQREYQVLVVGRLAVLA